MTDHSNRSEPVEIPLKTRSKWRIPLRKNAAEVVETRSSPIDEDDQLTVPPARWSLGVLNDRQTDEVPGMKAEVQP